MSRIPRLDQPLSFIQNNIKVTVTRERILRLYRFSVSDHTYKIAFKILSSEDQNGENENVPLFRDVVDTLARALVKILLDLFSYYEEGSRHQLYVHFKNPSFTSGSDVKTGNFIMFNPEMSREEWAGEIAEHSFNHFEYVLTSYESLSFDENLVINIKVLSVAHVEHRER